MPRSRASAATASPSSRARSASIPAPRARFTGRVVPPSAISPCGASSTNSTGIPSPYRVTCSCKAAYASALRSGGIPLPQRTADHGSARRTP